MTAVLLFYPYVLGLMAVTNESLQSENIGMETYNRIRYVHVHNMHDIVCMVRATVAAIMQNV